MNPQIPTEVQNIIQRLIQNQFQAFLVGGAVRDLFLKKKPKDWDIATDAHPFQVEKIFSKTIPTGKKFGTITVVTPSLSVQVTTFRSEGKYQNKRKPSKVFFESSLLKDLERRDFTMNAMAYDLKNDRFSDPFQGQKDLQQKKLKTVGNPHERFSEDALRMIRAARFISQFHLTPEVRLTKAVQELASQVSFLSPERIRDEMTKLLLGSHPRKGILWMDQTRLLSFLFPELLPCKGVLQGGFHHFDVFEHSLRAVEKAPLDLTLRLALLFHDVSKPQTKTKDEKGRAHFFSHEKMGAQVSEKILFRYRFPKLVQKNVSDFIRHHLFEVIPKTKESSLRRFLFRVEGPEKALQLIEMRKADILACGPNQKIPLALHQMEKSIEKIVKEKPALTLQDLAIDGKDIMKWYNLSPSPQIGFLLQKALGEVHQNPKKNQKNYLKKWLKNIVKPS